MALSKAALKKVRLPALAKGRATKEANKAGKSKVSKKTAVAKEKKSSKPVSKPAAKAKKVSSKSVSKREGTIMSTAKAYFAGAKHPSLEGFRSAISKKHKGTTAANATMALYNKYRSVISLNK